MRLSVIIPTHNRAEILKICLSKVLEQKGVDFEVIVVDDGSTDNTESVVREFIRKTDNLAYIKIPSSHQGVARNRGVKLATGEVIVFIGDDIFVEPEFLKKHHDKHTEHSEENIVVLGYSTWDPKLKINSYMQFLEESGWQFGYGFIRPHKMIGVADPYRFFYTSNISLKKSFFEKEQFNEDFKFYGWEDIELGYRLWKNHDMQIYYEPHAKAYHHHEIKPSDLPIKMRAVGRSAVYFERLQPSVRVVPRGIKKLIIKTATNRFAMPFSWVLGNSVYYKCRSWREFFVGTSEVK